MHDVSAYDWTAIVAELDAVGCARLPALLDASECQALRALYAEPLHFRSRVIMSRHGYGRGEYQYFDRPLPALVGGLREHAYPALAPIANAWAERLGEPQRFPSSLAELTALCAQAGQLRPTPLLLKYGPGDFNCLHQDLYGELAFPLQIAVLLSEPQREFSGGEFVLTEQRPRRQSRVEVVPLEQGDAVVFAVAARPIAGVRGDVRVVMRHGVSTLRAGARFTLGIIFHDAT